MSDLEKRVEAIEARNARVERDKKWETSWTRRISLALLTYLVIAVYLWAIDDDDPFIKAVVPAVGFFLSTLLLREVKNTWQRKNKQ